MRDIWRGVLGIGVPFGAIVGLLPVLGASRMLIFGMPLVVCWLFGWFFLTALCMAVVWVVFDRGRDDG
ncbi:hypothetical protein AA12717_1140 [Gluconacetobacter sacchari DSM 12717]|uniref:DUF3311 domain-containing protein n=2 Tax=Gluconacetobacter sacchari TaxID=92759 RepID=A0A7W4NLR6_9PROT|nr:DUF3311 domain-containing protein [Gluconacetobacter sacchari]MBB2160136.1 DUF3311 domain-containing protein [Gluconacetobacter sacchari]GBQ22287.1 hypothetical protein AA12717_1140 [Gluconacetobacter sacchari DSM 12717]